MFIGGANGSGKSTLGYLFNGLIPHFFGGVLAGTVMVDGIDTRKTGVADLFADVGLVLQNTDAMLFNSTVENEIAFGLESLATSAAEITRRLQEVSGALNIGHLLGRSPNALSGGEKRLVAIASVLCLNPSVLVLDEPYAGLDWRGIERVQAAIRETHRQGKTVVVVEQLINGFLEDAARCVLLDRGTIMFNGGSREGRDLLQRVHLVPRYPGRRKRSPSAGEPILVVEDLCHRLGEREVLQDISLELYSGETVAIVGPNAAGKTTLVKHLNGLLRPCRGRVVFQGVDIARRSPSEMASKVGLCFQSANDQFFKSRVKDELLAGLNAVGKRDEGWVKEICEIFKLDPLLGRTPYRLSEGEKKRVAIAAVVSMRPDVLVLDEPTSGQDGYFKEVLAALLADLEDRGVTIIVVTHDLDFARATAERWIVLEEGRVAADGSPEDVSRNGRFDRTLTQSSRSR
jgi:energy-coupling factor transporter ATP-binding protein EcfA2